MIRQKGRREGGREGGRENLPKLTKMAVSRRRWSMRIVAARMPLMMPWAVEGGREGGQEGRREEW